MLQFLKYVLATIVGLFLFSLLSLLIMGAIVAASAGREPVSVENNSILKLELNKELVERGSKDPIEELNLPIGSFESSIGLDQVLSAIRKAKKDDNIKGIYLQLSMPEAGMASLEEIRLALLDFKKSGKFILAYSDLYSEKAYYLSSVADKIYLNPVGALEFNGLGSELLFFKGTLDKLGIEPEIFKVGEFKSAVEPFIRTDMSEASRLQTTSFLNSINDYQLKQVAASRGRSFEYFKNVSDSMLVKNPEDALKYGLVTNMGYYEEAVSFMRGKTGKAEIEELEFVNLKDYRDVPEKKEGSFSSDKIAVIYASGNIGSGKGDDNSIGSEGTSAAIRKARLDKKVKAIVLRVNSPGGSALASDVIWHEIMITKKVKPVIASMSDVAASGGYYLAMACDHIVAHPTSITGSIGVFGVLANMEPFMADKLGITVDRVKTGKFSDVPTVTRALTDFEKKAIQHEVERIYDDFTRKAAEGRHMSQDKLKQYASGRVWSGAEAKENGLIDSFGGLEEAIKIAAQKAKLGTNYRVRTLPEQKGILEKILGDYQSQLKQDALKSELGHLYPAYAAYQNFGQLLGIQARMPFDLRIQ